MEFSRAIWTGASVCTALITALAAYSAMPKKTRQKIPDLPQQQYDLPQPAETAAEYTGVQTVPMPAEEAAVLPQTGYLLKLAGNQLSVYQEGERAPLETYELPAGALPDYDRILLEYGFKVPNEKELRHLLEDYLS